MIKLAEAYIHFSIDVKDVPPPDLRAFENEIYARYEKNYNIDLPHLIINH